MTSASLCYRPLLSTCLSDPGVIPKGEVVLAVPNLRHELVDKLGYDLISGFTRADLIAIAKNVERVGGLIYCDSEECGESRT